MRITFTAEEGLTRNVFVGLKNNFDVSGLGCLLNVDALAVVSAIANLDGVPMVAQMNARKLSGVIVVDVEDFGVAWSNAPGRLLTDTTH